MRSTQELANFVVTSRYADLPSSVVYEAKRSLLNWLGVAIGAAQHPTIDIARDTSRRSRERSRRAFSGEPSGPISSTPASSTARARTSSTSMIPT